MHAQLTQSFQFYVTLWTGTHQAPPSLGFSKARILGWVAMPSSRWSSQPRGWTSVSCTVGRFFAIWATGEAGIKEAGESYLNASFPKWPRSSTTNSKGSVGSLHFKISLFIATRSENCPFTHSGGHLLSCLICSHGASFLDMKTPDPPNLAHWHNTGQSNSSWAPLRLRGVGELKKKKKKAHKIPLLRDPESSRFPFSWGLIYVSLDPI